MSSKSLNQNSAVLLAGGSSWPLHTKAEKFENGAWTDVQDIPLETSLNYFAAIYDAGYFYYFGGYDHGPVNDINSILRLSEETWTWSNVGQLNRPRRSHAVILVDNTFMVIGGTGSFRNEACVLNNGQFTCEEGDTYLNRYDAYPLAFLVGDDYGQCLN